MDDVGIDGRMLSFDVHPYMEIQLLLDHPNYLSFCYWWDILSVMMMMMMMA
ncbi:hypothetical protein HanPI659440_Chr07g0266311 [Helianthus annuus]|nr:hypothetical protein HanPI659440_Chr07g0266311 [Helianthus annuus]